MNFPVPVFYGKPLRFEPNTHRYYWDGDPVRSVTTIIGRLGKPALIQWAANCAVESLRSHILGDMLFDSYSVEKREKICEEAKKAHAVKRDTAADIGTQVHDFALECFRANRPLPAPKDALDLQLQPACEAFCRWFKEHTVVTGEAERMVLSKTHGYAGRCDFLGHIDGQLGVLDIKTSSGVYPDHWLQLTAYQVALTEQLQMDVPMRWVLHLDKKTGAYRFHQKPFSQVAIDAWLALNTFDRCMRQLEKAA